MKAAVLLTVLVFSQLFANSAFANLPYPKAPDVELTPGELCSDPSSYRYPEKIPYCERNVHPETKRAIIRQYDQELGYRIHTMPRSKFKIDHYIPLCMGGSNDRDNLWPQHESVYLLTDELEQLLCEKMAEGRLTQSRAIDLIKEAKNNLDRVHEIRKEANSL